MYIYLCTYMYTYIYIYVYTLYTLHLRILILTYVSAIHIYSFSVCVFPSENDDDVVTSPYNSILASQQLIEHADCVFPLDNHALQGYAQLEQQQRLIADKRYSLSSGGVNSTNSTNTTNNSGNTNNSTNSNSNQNSSGAKGRGSGFDEMNSVAARMICHVSVCGISV